MSLMNNFLSCTIAYARYDDPVDEYGSTTVCVPYNLNGFMYNSFEFYGTPTVVTRYSFLLCCIPFLITNKETDKPFILSPCRK